MASSGGVRLKKKYGQNFLRDDRVINSIVSAVDLSAGTRVLEIGCGDGFLTRAILHFPISKLWAFEIDPEWVAHIGATISDVRLTVFSQDFLQYDCTQFQPDAPWVILSNLPYNITFPILEILKENRSLIKEGVLMVQEEVAQKIVKKRGKGYGLVSLYFQHYFDWKLLDKVNPESFYPAPSVFSRLLYLAPRVNMPEIPQEKEFWPFVKMAFQRPRRTLRNNLMQTSYPFDRLTDDILALRAQQLGIEDLLNLWNILRVG